MGIDKVGIDKVGVDEVGINLNRCPMLLRALGYAQSAITTSQTVCVAPIEILFAKNCRGPKIASEAIS